MGKLTGKRGRPRAKNAPTLQARGKGSWRVAWMDGGKRYRVGFNADDREAAKEVRSRIELALRGWGEWPPELATSPGVQAWLARNGTAKDVAEEYASALPVSEEWRKRTRAFIKEFDKFSGGLATATPGQARAWLASIVAGRSMETRNRRLVVLSKFYKYATRALGWPTNPFAGEKQSRPARRGDAIVYFDREERERLLQAADALPNGLVVWICLWAGVRRNEAWRLTWENIDLDAGTLTAQSKRGAPRAVPIAPQLKEKLAGLPGPRKGPLFDSTDAHARALLEGLARALPDLAGQIGYNAFRHTFCTLLVQAGVSLDKVSSWAGHHPAVCRAHYARFSPKTGGDADILKL